MLPGISLRKEERTMLFYEAPHKLTDTLDDFLAVFGGERRISLCRELTKLHEEVLRTTLAEAVEYHKEKEPRGEYVLVVEGAQPEVAEADPDAALTRVEQLREQGMSLKDAAAQAAAEFGMKKRQLYDMAIGK